MRDLMSAMFGRLSRSRCARQERQRHRRAASTFLLQGVMAAAVWFSVATVPVHAEPNPAFNRGDLWFAPNVRSKDWRELFLEPDSWSTARKPITTFVLPALRMLPELKDPVTSISDEQLQTLIRRLAAWRISFALEAGSVKPWGCRAQITSDRTLTVLDRIARLGGSVSYIVMDEPLYGGGPIKDGCDLSMVQAARQVDAYIAAVKQRYPKIKVASNEAWPVSDTAKIKQWLDVLSKTLREPLAFFQLDVDAARVKAHKVALGEIKEIADYSRSKGMPFRIVIWHAGATYPAKANDDASLYRSAMLFASEVSGITSVDGVTVQSWDEFPITTTPDSRANSLTNLLKDFARKYPPTVRIKPE